MSHMRGFIPFLFAAFVCSQAWAYNLNYGSGSLPLTAEKKTFPSLAVKIGETVYYGALFTYPAQTNTIRLDVNGTLYWAGVYCTEGTYSDKGHEPCDSCGSGYWCIGGPNRSACSGLGTTGQSPTGGSYSSVSPFSVNTNCRYTAPAKTITGCSSVTSNAVAWTGSAWPATTYNVSASAGYIIANNGTASATCSACGTPNYSTGGSATSCSACSGLAGVSPAGGTYVSVSPFNANTTCRYTAPVKTITGCATVTSNQVSYSGSAWPASTYNVSASAGYIIANNGTASATCSACGTPNYSTGGSATACSACSGLAGVSPAGGTYVSVSPFNANTTCRYTAPAKTITGCATVTSNQVSYSGSAWPASTYNVSASAGYYIANNGTASATCTICPVGSYCTGGSAGAVACSTVCTGCSTTGTGATSSAACTSPVIIDYGAGIYTWNGSDWSLPDSYNGSSVNQYGSKTTETFLNSISDTVAFYALYQTYWLQAICSSTSAGTQYAKGNPVYSSSGLHCWCRLKRRSDSVNGTFVYLYPHPTAADCANKCPFYCAPDQPTGAPLLASVLNAFLNP